MRSPLLPIFLVVLVDVLGLTLMLPLLPLYAEKFGATPFIATTLASSFAACQLISGPILGRLSDRIGRKPVLLASQVGTFIGFLIIGGAQSLWMLFLGRVIDGVTAGNLSIAQAYISDVTTTEKRTRAFALIGIAFGLGFLVGPAISGELARYDFRYPAFAAAGLSMLSILTTSLILPNAAPTASSAAQGRSFAFSRYFSRPQPRMRLIQFFAFVLAFATIFGGLALFLEHSALHYDVHKAGYIYAYAGFVGLIVQGGLIGRLVKKLGEVRLAVVGFATMALGYGMLGVASDLTRLLVIMTVAGFGSAITRPAMTSLITKSVGRDEQGAALGVSQSLASIANIVGPPIAGSLIQARAFNAYGLAAAAVAAIGAVLLLAGDGAAEISGG